MTALTILLPVFLCVVVMYLLMRIERKKILARSSSREAEYRNLIENIGVVMYSADTRGLISFANLEVTELTGYTTEELKGKHYSILLDPDWVKPVNRFYENQFLGQQPLTTLQFCIRTKSGEQKWVEQSAKLSVAEGRVLGFQCYVKDITTQKETEEELKESERQRKEQEYRLHAIMDNAATIIFIKDLEGRYLMANRSFKDLMKITDENIIQKTDYDLTTPDRADYYKRMDEEVIRSKKHVQIEILVETAGDTRNYLLVKFPLLDDNGNVFGISGIATDITDNVRAQHQVQKALAEAKEAYDLQEQFLANMSHEIQTPLAGVQGMIELLRETKLSENQTGFVEAVHTSVSRLQGILNNILDFTNLKAGKLLLRQATIDARQVLSNIETRFAVQAKEKGLAFQTHIADNVPSQLRGDVFRLQQLLVNLVDNAIKFTTSGTVSVDVQAQAISKERTHLSFTVTDTGIGISPDRYGIIFKPFAQVAGNTSTNYGGTGLGLPVSKALVEFQGGEISVQANPGGGTIFSFYIPYRLSTLSAAVADEVPKGTRVLVVDDNDINQRLVERALQEIGAVTGLAFNGREAIELLKKNQYDLVIMDIMMPVMGGIEAIAYIRNELRLSIPVIAVTAAFLKDQEQKCREAGANDFMAKPFNFPELYSRMARLLVGKEIHFNTNKPEDNNNGLFNLAGLEELEDDEYVAEMISLFLSHTPEEFTRLSDLAEKENWKELAQLAHRIKGSVGMVRAEKLAAALKEIELLADTGSPSVKSIQQEIKKAMALFEILERALQDELEKRKKQLAPQIKSI